MDICLLLVSPFASQFKDEGHGSNGNFRCKNINANEVDEQELKHM